MGEPLRVALPPGIGDVHWTCQKLRGLSEYVGGRPIHAYVGADPSHASVHFLKLVPYVAQAFQDKEALDAIVYKMPPNHRDPRWSTLEGCANWQGFDYILVANGHLERGERIETWLPEIDTEYTYPLLISDETKVQMQALAGVRPTLVYMSGTGPNIGFHNGWWDVGDWVDVVARLNVEGIEPVLIGAANGHDEAYRDWFVRAGGKRLKYLDLIGQTTHEQVCALVVDASVWVGLNSGTGIIAAMQGTPTVMMWSDDRYEVPGAGTVLHRNLKTSWLADEQLSTYRTLSYGSPELTPENTVKAMLEVRR